MSAQRRSSIPAAFQCHEGRTDGTYVVVTRNNAWGRGTTLEEAFRNAREAGGRNLTARNVAIVWQADRVWQELRALRVAEGSKGEGIGRPTVDCVSGAVTSWGPCETLHRPVSA